MHTARIGRVLVANGTLKLTEEDRLEHTDFSKTLLAPTHNWAVMLHR